MIHWTVRMATATAKPISDDATNHGNRPVSAASGVALCLGGAVVDETPDGGTKVVVVDPRLVVVVRATLDEVVSAMVVEVPVVDVTTVVLVVEVVGTRSVVLVVDDELPGSVDEVVVLVMICAPAPAASRARASAVATRATATTRLLIWRCFSAMPPWPIPPRCP